MIFKSVFKKDWLQVVLILCAVSQTITGAQPATCTDLLRCICIFGGIPEPLDLLLIFGRCTNLSRCNIKQKYDNNDRNYALDGMKEIFAPASLYQFDLYINPPDVIPMDREDNYTSPIGIKMKKTQKTNLHFVCIPLKRKIYRSFIQGKNKKFNGTVKKV